MAGGVVGVRGEVGVVAGGLELLLYMGVLCLNCAGRVVVAFGAAGSSVCLLVCKASRAEPAVKNNQGNKKKVIIHKQVSATPVDFIKRSKNSHFFILAP